MKLRSIALLLLAAPFLSAQNSVSNNMSCKPNRQAASPAEIAYVQGDYKKAADLFTSEVAAAPTDERLGAARIQTPIAKGDLDEAAKAAAAFTAAKPGQNRALRYDLQHAQVSGDSSPNHSVCSALLIRLQL